MSKKRGKRHLKRNAPSLRKDKHPVVAPRIAERQGVDFYEIALTVERDDDGVLRRVAEPVGELSAEVKRLGYRMAWITTNDGNCAGIAAPQMGESVRLISVRDMERKVHVVVNPEIRRTVNAIEVIEYERCFSLPDERVPIKRWSAVALVGTDLSGHSVRLTLTGMAARAAQHEIDHLNGVLISDHGDVRGVIAAADG